MWIAEMAVIVDGMNISDEYFEGEFENVREMVEMAQDDFIDFFADSVYFSVRIYAV